MAPSVTHAVVTIPAASGLPEDDVVNTWTVFSQDGSSHSTPGEITIPLAGFYTTATGQVHAIGSWLSSDRSRTASACTIELFDVTNNLDGSAHGPAYMSDTFTLPAVVSGEKGLPNEVAVCLTFFGLTRNSVSPEVADDADPAGPDPGLERDRPMQRRTGRVYIGPLCRAVADAAGTRVVADLMDDLEIAQGRLRDQLAPAGNDGPHAISVWSRRNAALYLVTGGFVDNAFDTQRRRGVSPTVRNTFI